MIKILGTILDKLGLEFGPKVFWLQRNIHEIVENRIKQKVENPIFKVC